MTDRIHALTVVLNNDIREDDVEYTLNAIRMIRTVADVEMHVADVEAYMARARVSSDIKVKIYEAIHEIFNAKGG